MSVSEPLSGKAPVEQGKATAVLPRADQRVLGVRHLVSEAARALGPRRWGLVRLGMFAFLQSTLETAVLYLVARVALALSNSETTIHVAIGPVPPADLSRGEALAVAGALLVVVLAVSVPVARYSGNLSASAIIRVRTRLAEAWFHASPAHRAEQRESHLQTILLDYTNRTERLVQQAAALVVAATSLVVMAVGTLVVAPGVALLAMVGLSLLALCMRPFSASMQRTSRELATMSRGLAGDTAQVVRLTQEIAAFDATEPFVEEIRGQIDAVGVALGRVRFRNILAPTLYQYAALAVVLGIAALLLALGSGDNVGAAAPVLLLMVRSLTYAKQLQTSVQTGNEMAPFLEVVDQELKALLAHPAPDGDAQITGAGELAAEDLTFAYRVGVPVLEGVSFSIAAGSAVGVVGPSGGGKSTLVHLLVRLRTPSSGRILIDGIDLGSVAHASLAHTVALVPQDNKLLYGSIADNIAFRRPGFTRDEIVAAARAAHLDEDIDAFPDGYDTLIGPGARDVSGGQRQRLGIARALLGRPKVLILDEPTSALDARSEHLIRDTLVEMRGRTTIVAVAHRPATLDICDRVLRVEGGRVTEIAPSHPRAS